MLSDMLRKAGMGLRMRGEDEIEGEDVGTDHPLAMDDELPVARGEEGGQGAEEPEGGHDDVPEGEDAAGLAQREDTCQGSRDGDGDDIDAAEDAVALEVAGAEAGGEEEWAEGDGDGSGEYVGREEEKFADEIGAVFAGLVQEGKVGIEEDEKEGDAEDDPEDGLGG